VTNAFSRVLAAGEGRYLTPIEEEFLHARALEWRQRATVSRLIEASEFSIVDYATQAFCDVMHDFEGPRGSVRRKKGHQDGRIMLRYITQAIREGAADIFFEKVLSWLIGHLDERNVTGHHMEVFVHFLHQGVRRELPDHWHGFVDPVFEDVVGFIRRASHSGTIQRAHRRIAEFAVNRIMDILPDVKAAYGVSSMPKCKRDFELLTKEVARLMKATSQQEMNRQFAAWLVDRLMNQVGYDPEVWHWSFLALREAVVHCCGPEAGASVSELFESMADRAPELAAAVRLQEIAGDLASETSDRLIEMGQPLGLLRKDEFKTAVTMVDRELVTQLAILNASGPAEDQLEAMAALWCDEVTVKLPSRDTSFLAANLKALLEVATERLNEQDAELFRDSVMRLVAVARRCETADRLSEAADEIAAEATEWARESLGTSAHAARSCYRDLRLSLAHVAALLPAGPASVNGHEFRRYLTRYTLPQEPSTPQVMEQVYRKVIELAGVHLGETDARLVCAYFEESIPCFERHSRLKGMKKHIAHFAVPAVERGYQADPRHDSLKRHGVQAGQRDGIFLLEKAIDTAIIAGAEIEREFQEYFLVEQVRLSRLPGGVIVEFVRGLQEQVRDYPEVVGLLVGLAKVAPAYSASLKLIRHSTQLAERISQEAIKQSPGYRERIGDAGLEACTRDNSVMIRGLARAMQVYPLDVVPFREWWMRRIGKNIRNLPETADASNMFSIINVRGLLEALQRDLDQEEWNYVADYLHRVVEPEGAQQSGNSNGRPLGGGLAPSLAASTPMTFSDVIA
jgi:hypothetical protein